jgi:hypothetical protein
MRDVNSVVRIRKKCITVKLQLFFEVPVMHSVLLNLVTSSASW